MAFWQCSGFIFLAVKDIWPPCVRVTVVRSPVLQVGTLFIITADSPATIGRFVLFSLMPCGSRSYISVKGLMLPCQAKVSACCFRMGCHRGETLVLRLHYQRQNDLALSKNWEITPLARLQVVSHLVKIRGIDLLVSHKNGSENSLKTTCCLSVAERKTWTMQSEYQKWESARYRSPLWFFSRDRHNSFACFRVMWCL